MFFDKLGMRGTAYFHNELSTHFYFARVRKKSRQNLADFEAFHQDSQCSFIIQTNHTQSSIVMTESSIAISSFCWYS